MKIKLKTLADKITAVALYLICMTIVISLFLEVSYMADYGFYDKFQLTESTTTRLMKEKVDKEYSNIEEYVLLSLRIKLKSCKAAIRITSSTVRFARNTTNVITQISLFSQEPTTICISSTICKKEN